MGILTGRTSSHPLRRCPHRRTLRRGVRRLADLAGSQAPASVLQRMRITPGEAMVDHLAATAGRYELQIGPCPACEQQHRVTLSHIGWFAFRCGTKEMTGQVDNWIQTRRAHEARCLGRHDATIVVASPE
jgi:hypothetical protein